MANSGLSFIYVHRCGCEYEGQEVEVRPFILTNTNDTVVYHMAPQCKENGRELVRVATKKNGVRFTDDW